jgi:hypothetical protein
VARGGDFRRYGAPEEARCAKSVHAHDRGTAMAVPFDVDGAWSDGDAQQVGFDTKASRRKDSNERQTIARGLSWFRGVASTLESRVVSNHQMRVVTGG